MHVIVDFENYFANAEIMILCFPTPFGQITVVQKYGHKHMPLVTKNNSMYSEVPNEIV